MVKLGEDIKVYLRGESPWGIVAEIIDETHIKAQINNDLVNTGEHGVVRGDIIAFELRELVKGHPSWEHIKAKKVNQPLDSDGKKPCG